MRKSAPERCSNLKSNIEKRPPRIVLILPGLAGEPSVLRQKLPALQRLAESGKLFKLGPLPEAATPEAFYLGLSPSQAQLAQGPLTVSALGVDPPERSTHFHLSLLSCSDGVVSIPRTGAKPIAVPGCDQRQIFDLAKKLDTKALTVVEGEGLDHGLVWESLGDLATTDPVRVDGKPMRLHLPEGDGEVQLRRFIDDSVNLLAETELNLRRMDDDLPPLNLLWPWGQGIRTPVPNLALRRGDPAWVVSTSLRLQGLARLAGYRHTSRLEFGAGLNMKLQRIAEHSREEPASIVLIDAFAELRGENQIDESAWLIKEIDYRLLAPRIEAALSQPSLITVLAPGSETSCGIGMTVLVSSSQQASNSLPFDERSLDERGVPTLTLWDAVAGSL